MDIIRKFFRLNTNQPNNNDSFDTYNVEPHLEQPNNDLFGRFNDNPSNSESRHFNVFSDPLEMHRYFEQQMDQLFRSFGIPNFGSFFDGFQHPAIEGHFHEDEQQAEDSGDIRDQFLKRGYNKPYYGESEHKVDSDLDDKLDFGDTGSIFNGRSNRNQLELFKHPSTPFGGMSFNQSVQVKTIRKPDGTLETHRIVRDSQGNEETTISKKINDKEYTVVKKRDKSGKEEIHETMVNMDESEKSLFERSNSDNGPFRGDGGLFDSSLFNRFFK